METLNVIGFVVEGADIQYTQSIHVNSIVNTIRATAVNPVTLDGSGTTTPTEPTLTFYW